MDSQYYKNIVFRSAIALSVLVILTLVGAVIYWLGSLAYFFWHNIK